MLGNSSISLWDLNLRVFLICWISQQIITSLVPWVGVLLMQQRE